MLTEHKKVFLSINGAQSERFEKGTIKFKYNFKQTPVSFKIYADFECNLETVESWNLIMSEKEDQFQSSNTYWICEKLIDNDDEKVRGHCHITRKFRGAAHCSCNIFNCNCTLQLTK